MILRELLLSGYTNTLFYVFPKRESTKGVEIYSPDFFEAWETGEETPWRDLLLREVDRIDAGVAPWERARGRETPLIYVFLKGGEEGTKARKDMQ